ncbi:hypothetical protein XM38_032520 [Halomicronema hongdechloris C2206]|uniref:Uncharacterized protein n=1 Tax=Halomicronema hongdechloris C2206 TaxID=1641165 RepID=A0A1Z3HPX0_9CYAN|nr:hypothetical protein [Halomicronema hongdechloris]ASC72296.1 hypothetical protein XM38_032520 [Halomicronema hongdechloris C2206]
MYDYEALAAATQRYRPLLGEYWHLAMEPSLDEAAADRVEAILQQAQADPWLSLLLDEVDYLLAHVQGLLDEDLIADQQAKLRTLLEPHSNHRLLAVHH